MRASASKAGLLSHCAYAFRDDTPWVEDKGRAAINGDRFHQAIATYIETGVRPVQEGRPLKWLEERLDHAILWVDANKTVGWRAEVAYAYDPQTGAARVLGYNIGREYDKHGKLPNEIAGSADIAWMEGDAVVVSDWKTGRAVTDAVWPQMEWLCLFAQKATGAWQARAQVLHATDYGVVVTERSYSDLELWRIAEQLKMDVNAVDDAWPNTGEWCDSSYCPARAGCQLYQIQRKGAA